MVNDSLEKNVEMKEDWNQSVISWIIGFLSKAIIDRVLGLNHVLFTLGHIFRDQISLSIETHAH